MGAQSDAGHVGQIHAAQLSYFCLCMKPEINKILQNYWFIFMAKIARKELWLRQTFFYCLSKVTGIPIWNKCKHVSMKPQQE